MPTLPSADEECKFGLSDGFIRNNPFENIGPTGTLKNEVVPPTQKQREIH